MSFLYSPWPWYLTGPLIGITVPLLLFMGNKKLGVSSSLKQICAVAVPAFGRRFDWKRNAWNLYFVGGILIGGYLGGAVFANPAPVHISEDTVRYLSALGLTSFDGLLPSELFNWQTLFTAKGFFLIVAGGFLVGFGTTWAKGCTSGHGILGMSAMQWPSLVATASFFGGGILFSQFVLPVILSL
jgi:uncharacterized protein